METIDDGWGELERKQRDIRDNALVGLVRLSWELTPRYPQAWHYTPGQLSYLAMLEAERGRQDLVQAAIAVRAGGADDDWWKRWIRSHNR